jgi:hypothetical protein
VRDVLQKREVEAVICRPLMADQMVKERRRRGRVCDQGLAAWPMDHGPVGGKRAGTCESRLFMIRCVCSVRH